MTRSARLRSTSARSSPAEAQRLPTSCQCRIGASGADPTMPKHYYLRPEWPWGHTCLEDEYQDWLWAGGRERSAWPDDENQWIYLEGAIARIRAKTGLSSGAARAVMYQAGI